MLHTAMTMPALKLDELATALHQYAAVHARNPTSAPPSSLGPAVTKTHALEASASPESSRPLEGNVAKDPLIMYVVLRKDLDWPMGAIINQACHVSTAVTWESRDDPDAVLYFQQADGQMTTATLGVDGELSLTKLVDKLQRAGIPHKLWVEQPENIAVALATWPRRRSVAQKCFNGVKRF